MGRFHHAHRRGGGRADRRGSHQIRERLRNSHLLRMGGNRLRYLHSYENCGGHPSQPQIGAGPFRDDSDPRPGDGAFAVHRDEVPAWRAGRAGHEENTGAGRMRRSIALGAMAAALILTGCGPLGKVDQGRVIAYDAHTRRVTLIPEAIPEAAGGPRLGPGTLPPVTVEAPLDPSEMGPAPVAGGLMLLDSSKARIVVYDRSTEAFRTIQYTLVA